MIEILVKIYKLEEKTPDDCTYVVGYGILDAISFMKQCFFRDGKFLDDTSYEECSYTKVITHWHNLFIPTVEQLLHDK